MGRRGWVCVHMWGIGGCVGWSCNSYVCLRLVEWVGERRDGHCSSTPSSCNLNLFTHSFIIWPGQWRMSWAAPLQRWALSQRRGGGVRNKLMKDWNLLNFPFLTWSGSGRNKQAASRSELLWLLSGIVKEVWGVRLCRTDPDVVAIRLRWASWGDWKDQEGEDSLVPRGICAHSDVQVAVEGEIRPNWNTNVPLYRGRNYNARDFRF